MRCSAPVPPRSRAPYVRWSPAREHTASKDWPADQVPALMADFADYINSALHAPLIQAALVHAQFETIHPLHQRQRPGGTRFDPHRAATRPAPGERGAAWSNRMDALPEAPPVTARTVERLLNASFPAARQALEELAEAKILHRKQVKQNTTDTSPVTCSICLRSLNDGWQAHAGTPSSPRQPVRRRLGHRRAPRRICR